MAEPERERERLRNRGREMGRKREAGGERRGRRREEGRRNFYFLSFWGISTGPSSNHYCYIMTFPRKLPSRLLKGLLHVSHRREESGERTLLTDGRRDLVGLYRE